MKGQTKAEEEAIKKAMEKNKEKYKADELKNKDKLAIPTKD